MIESGAAQLEHRDDRQFRQDQRDQQLDRAHGPQSSRGPDQGRECERQHQHNHVHGRLAYSQLEPQHDRAGRSHHSDEEPEEGGGPGDYDASDVCQVEAWTDGPCRRRHNSAQLIGGREEQHRHRRRDADREHRQREVPERGSRQQREVRAKKRLDRRGEQKRQRQQGGDPCDSPVRRREPGGAELGLGGLT